MKVKKTMIVVTALIGLGFNLIFGTVIPLPFATNPGRIEVNSKGVFIIDGYDIYILSTENFSILKKYSWVIL